MSAVQPSTPSEDLRARTEANMKRFGIPKGMHDPAADEWMRQEAARVRPIDRLREMFGIESTDPDAVFEALAKYDTYNLRTISRLRADAAIGKWVREHPVYAFSAALYRDDALAAAEHQQEAQP